MKKKLKKADKSIEKSFYNKLYIFLGLILFLFIIYPRVEPYLRGDNISKDTGEFIFRDPDSCYHARRIIYTAEHNMRLPFYDSLLAYPVGAIPIWSPAYDWFSALPSYIIGFGSPSKNFIIWVAIWLNLIFGLLQIYYLALLLYKAMDMKTAFLAALFIGIADPHIANSSIERLDHNSFVLLIFTIILYEEYKLLKKTETEIYTKNILILSFLTALLFWIWPGSYIYLAAIIFLNLLYVILSRKYWLLSHLSSIFLLSSSLIFPLALLHYTLSKATIKFEYVSFFTVLFLLATSAFFYLLRVLLLIKKSFNYLLLGKCLLLILILTSIILYSYTPLIQGLKYAKAQNKWLSTILESKPIFYLYIGTIKMFTTEPIILAYGYIIFVFPLIFFLILFNKIKISSELYSIIIIISFLFAILTLYQRRFAFEFSIPYAITFSVFFSRIYDKLIQRRQIFLTILVSLLLVISFIPLRSGLFNRSNSSAFYALYEGFKWLRDGVARPSPGAPPEGARVNSALPGVMAPWDLGHHIQFYSEMPTVADNFGFIYMNLNPWQGFYDMARFFLTESEEEAVQILKKYKCKYVVVPNSSIYEPYTILLDMNPTLLFDYRIEMQDGKKYLMVGPKDKFFNTIGFRLSEAYGSANPTPEERGMRVKALKHFQLIYELPYTKMKGGEFPNGSLKIYKYTDGIIINADVDKNTPYKLEAAIITNTGNKFYYRQYGIAKEGIIMPYPNVHYDLSF